MTFAAIDFETTGTVKGYENEPWQIGIVLFDPASGGIDEMWESHLHIPPTRPFSKYAPGRWAQIRDDLAAAPHFHEIWHDISSRIAGVPLVAHNAGTERTILTRLAPLTPFGPWHDTLKMLKRGHPGLPSYKLGAAVDAFALAPMLKRLFPERTFHDALYDAAATALLFSVLAQNNGFHACAAM